MRVLSAAVCLVLAGAVRQAHGGGEGRLPPIQPNTWVKVDIDWKAAMPKDLRDARWATGDGYSDNTFRTKTGSVLIRTGVRSRTAGLSPGFYTNATVEWNLKTDAARVVDIANWGGGSYGHGKLLPAFKDHPTPTPRHTYDGICYLPEQDAVYLMLGANWRVGARGATEEAKKTLALDNKSTWKYSFKTSRWKRIDHNVYSFFKCSPYESHLQHWPEAKRLLFFDSSGRRYAEFDLKTEKWEQVAVKNKPPHTLYHARSTWDSKRQLWVFRLGPQACAFSPKTREFKALPNCWDLPVPEDKKQRKGDKRFVWKGICYISRHDVYLISGPTGNDTRIYDIAKGKWIAVKGGDTELVNGYCQYDPATDVVAMNFQLQCFKFRYVPADGDEKSRSE